MSREAYSVLGGYYDKLISDYPYSKLTDKLKSYLTGKGFDLGSGSGLITVELAKIGLTVIGVDSSEEMLSVARERAKNEKVKPVFVKGDVASFEFTKSDFVIATCDVFNYLSSKKTLENLIKRIYFSLKDGGKLVFDLRRGEILKKMAGEVYFEDLEELTYLWSNSLNGDKLAMDISFFSKREDGLYERGDERHEMLVLSDEYVVNLLESIGFSVKTYGDKLGKIKQTDKRTFFFCTKK